MSQTASFYRPDIDGLRAIAILMVVLFHAGVPSLSAGFAGVNIFFVISGYLIGGMLIRDIEAGTFSYAHFYARRARRILPALICVVVASCLAGLLLLPPNDLSNLAISATTTLLGVSNIYYYLYYDYFNYEPFNTGSWQRPLFMGWSLGVEEQFYLLFPWLLLVLSRRHIRLGPVIAAISAFSLLLFFYTVAISPKAALHLLPMRAWELGAGVLLSLYHIRHPGPPISAIRCNLQAIAGIIMLVLFLMTSGPGMPDPSYTALLPVGSTLLLLDAQASWINRRLLSSQPMVFIGLVSYSWYLWHWPLLAYARSISVSTVPLDITLNLAAVSFVIASLSWRWIEQPFRRMNYHPRNMLRCYGMALMLVMACTVKLQLSNGLPSRLPLAAVKVDTTVAEAQQVCLAVTGEEPDSSPGCLPPNKSKPAIAVIGDDHTSTLMFGLKPLATERHMRVLMFTRTACPPLLDIAPARFFYPVNATECAAFMHNAIERIESDPSIRTVVVGGYWQYPDFKALTGNRKDELLNALTAVKLGLPPLLERLDKAGKHIVIAGNMPFFHLDVAHRALAESMPVRHWLIEPYAHKRPQPGGFVENSGINADIGALIEEFARQYHADYIDLSHPFCNADGCLYQWSYQLLFIDNAHLSVVGSQRIRWPESLWH